MLQLEVILLRKNAWVFAHMVGKSSNRVAKVDWDGVVRAMSEGETTIIAGVQEGSLEAGFQITKSISQSITIKVEGVGDNTELG